MAAIAAELLLLALAACTHSGAPVVNATATDSAQAATSADADTDTNSGMPKVPFGNRPCHSLSQNEQKSLGFNLPLKATASRTPDELPYDNTCSYESVGAFAIEYTTRKDYEYQRDNLRKASHPAPAEIPGSFYDVLGNLWFAKNGYYVAVTNVGQPIDIEKVTTAIATKL
ncbi:MAG TPA: hypothetical protein VJ727_10290 [Rhodanobacteraceae bacterium]|nr:hypothetical protein [Rhodanobacteraceae bacterium]